MSCHVLSCLFIERLSSGELSACFTLKQDNIILVLSSVTELFHTQYMGPAALKKVHDVERRLV